MSTVAIKNDMELSIREAVPEEAEIIINYVNTIAAESENITFGPGEFEITVEEETELIRNIAESSNKIFIVGYIGDELVSFGNMFGGKRPRIRHSADLGISVLKKYWRKGIVMAMMRIMINWGQSVGLRKINLRVRTDNLGAIALYRFLGFNDEGVITREFYIRGEFYSTLHMGLELNSE